MKYYFLKEHLRPFLAGLGVFIFVLFMGNIMDVMRIAIGREAGLLALAGVVYNTLIYAASFSIPLATLLAVLLAVGRLNSDNEITAAMACGISPVKALFPVILASLFISVSSVHLNSVIVPRKTAETTRLLSGIALEDPSRILRERTLIEDFGDVLIYINRRKGEMLYGVHITRLSGDGFPVSVSAREGTIEDNSAPGKIHLRLKDAIVDETEPREPYRIRRTNLNQYSIFLPVPRKDAVSASARPKDMTLSQLGGKTAELLSLNMDPAPLVTEINRKLAQSFAPFSLALIAVPLGLMFRKGGKPAGFGLCLLTVVLYYVMFTGAVALGEKGIVNGAIVWAPNVLAGLSGALMSLRLL